MKHGLFFAVAALSVMSLPSMPAPSLEFVPPSRGPAPPILTRGGYQTSPLELHKLARKNKRRGRR